MSVLAGDQPLPGGELTPVLEVARIGERTHAGDRGQALRHSVPFDVVLDLHLARGDGCIEPRESLSRA
jgi:hypothetical protein